MTEIMNNIHELLKLLWLKENKGDLEYPFIVHINGQTDKYKLTVEKLNNKKEDQNGNP